MVNKNDFYAVLRAGQESYAPNESVAAVLGDKEIVMLVGPAGIGKSTLMNRIVEEDIRFHRAPSFTTREPRPNDEPGMYHYISSDLEYAKLQQQIANKDIVQYGVSPVKDLVYGTYAGDYMKEYNLKDVWYSSVEEMKKLPFKNNVVIGLVTDPNDWASWFNQRFLPDDPERKTRLEEAKLCLPWLINNKDTHWVVNLPNDIHSAATAVINICTGTPSAIDGAPLAKGMLEKVAELESQSA